MEKIRILIGELPVASSDGFTDQELYKALGSLVQTQEAEDLLYEVISLHEFDEHYNPGTTSFNLIQEAVSFNSYTALKKGIQNLGKKMSEALRSSDITLVSDTKPEELKPRKNKLFAFVAAQFNFSDGQSVKILFHSPHGDARNFDKDDVLVSYAHSLNGRDVTHLFAQREGLTTQKFSKRMMQILEKNSEKFVARQKGNQEKKAALEAQSIANEDLELKNEQLASEIKMKQLENDGLLEAVNGMQSQIETKQVSIANLNDQIAMAKSDREAQLADKTDEAEGIAGDISIDYSSQIMDLTNINADTFAGVTGIEGYVAQEPVFQQWRDWIGKEMSAGKSFDNWQSAWAQYEQTLPEDDGTGEEVPGGSESKPWGTSSWGKEAATAFVNNELLAGNIDLTEEDKSVLRGHFQGFLEMANRKLSGSLSNLGVIEAFEKQKATMETGLEYLGDGAIDNLPGSDMLIGTEYGPDGAKTVTLDPSDPKPPNGGEAVATANSILSGDFDADPKELEAKFEEILGELEASDPDLLEKVSNYYTELLSKLAVPA
ncbi:MAG: hypothetical protein HOB38_18960 [Deltaproteobacteria bacterium]|jgi:hypothetical protein|nr:hypothetical protein [Deltaproteobacteria bacterium]MBT6614184.1 hypothetical protein [Deltaproteobacteria bacterium]